MNTQTQDDIRINKALAELLLYRSIGVTVVKPTKREWIDWVKTQPKHTQWPVDCDGE